METKSYSLNPALMACVAVLAAMSARAVDFHVATAQALQNALTLAAANGANNTIYVTNGHSQARSSPFAGARSPHAVGSL